MRESKALVFGEMFCTKCGETYNDYGDLFCTHCGNQRRAEGKTNNATESPRQSSKETRETKTLQQYMAGKSKERCGFFNRKRKQQQHHPATESSKRPSDSRVVINVGIIAENEKGNLSVLRGSKIPLKVCKDFSSEQTLTAAVKKHADHDQFFSAVEDYVLLYPHQKLVKYVPGTNEDFSVAGYKKEFSKPYSKLDLFLCKTHEYTQHIAEAEGNEDMAMESFKAG